MINTTRFSGLFTMENTGVWLIGLGGIGAPIAISLAKSGIGQLTMWDGDRVSVENTGSQLHGPGCIGYHKVSSLEFIMDELAGPMPNLLYIDEEFPSWLFVPPANIIISAVDSIQARKSVWDAISANVLWDWYIDARMSAEVFQMYVVGTREQSLKYEAILMDQSDEGIPDVPCTQKSTFYTGLLAGAKVCAAVANIVRGIETPFFYEDRIRDFQSKVYAWN